MAVNNLRQQNIFDQFMQAPAEYGMDQFGPFGSPMGIDLPESPQPASSWDFGIQQPPQQDPLDIYNYTPEVTSRDRFNRLLDQYPTRQAPSLGRTLVASGMGFGGTPIGDVEKVMQAPHLRDMADWSARTQPFYNAAQLENQSNIQERTLTTNAIAARTAQSRTDEMERSARAREETNRMNAESNRIKALAQDFKMRNPNWIFKSDGPTIVGFNPTNPKEFVDTGVSTGNMSDMEKIWWNTAGQIAVKQTPPPARTPESMSPGDQGKARDLLYEKLYHTDPLAGKWIEFNGTNYQMKAKPTNPQELAEWSAVANRIYTGGGDGPIKAGPVPPSAPSEPGILDRTWNWIWGKDEQSPTASASAPPPVAGAPPTKTGNQTIGGNNRPPPAMVNYGTQTVKPPTPPAPQQPAQAQSSNAIEVFDKNGKWMGWMEATPENVAEAKAKGYRMRVGGGG